MLIKVRGLTCLLALLVLVAPAQALEGQFSFGIVPQQAASRLARDWTPLLDRVGQTSATRLAFATAPDIPEFEARLARGEYDFAYMNPYHYTVFSAAPGYRALARQADKQIRGLLVVAADSPVTSLPVLAGGTLAFPAPAAFAATLLPRAHLDRLGIAYQSRFVGSHDSVYRNVAAGRVDAGGGIQRTFDALDPEIRAKLRVLWTSPGFTPHAIAVHPRVPEEIARAVAEALVELGSEASGATLLEPLKMKGFMRAQDRDWDDVRALGITLEPDATTGAR